MAFLPGEDVINDNPLVDLIREYGLKNYGELWRISLIEFLQLPKFQIELLRKITDQVNAEKKRTLDDVMGSS